MASRMGPDRKAGGKPRLRNLLGASDWAVHEPPNAGDLEVARVYVNYGVESGVRLGDEYIRLRNKRSLPTVAGDLVYTDGIQVLGIQPRGRVLARYADPGGVRLIASQLDQVGVVVSASLPPLQEGFLDRYLIFCRIVELPLFVVLNKMDEARDGIEGRLEPFREAGVDVYPTSAATGEGLEELEERLSRGITVLSGLSGVGKSTLINALLDEEIPVQEISSATGKGRHTTTAAEAYEFAGTLLIDSPGIKKFGFIGVTRDQIIRGFPDFQPFLQQCRFEDCEHVREAGCGVRQAVEDGRLDGRRHAAYVELMETLEAEG